MTLPQVAPAPVEAAAPTNARIETKRSPRDLKKLAALVRFIAPYKVRFGIAMIALALAAGLTYTRYSDDITFSTAGDFDRARAKKLITAARRILAAG